MTTKQISELLRTLGEEVYKACLDAFDKLDREGLFIGNSHHAAQEVSAAAQEVLCARIFLRSSEEIQKYLRENHSHLLSLPTNTNNGWPTPVHARSTSIETQEKIKKIADTR